MGLARRAQLSDRQRAILKGIRLAVFDVDGTLTDGRVTHGNQGELQSFCVRDGQGLVWLRQARIQVCWITGRGCAATRLRAKELGVDELHIKSGPKAEVLRSVQARLDIAPLATLSMGDDLPDLALASLSAFFAAPQDACKEVQERADWVSTAPAGAGAARELAELLLKAQDRWDELLKSYNVDA